MLAAIVFAGLAAISAALYAPTNGERYRVQGAYPNVTIEKVRSW